MTPSLSKFANTPNYTFKKWSAMVPFMRTAAFLLLLGTAHIDGFSLPRLPATSSALSHAIDFGNDAAPTKLFVGRDIEQNDDAQKEEEMTPMTKEATTSRSALWGTLTRGGPPLDIDDVDLLLYDVFLLMNLSVSASFFVVHRMDLSYLPSGLNEGALLSICWIIAGLANGSFLSSAVDGHYDPAGEDYEEKGGPRAAGLLAVSTFVSTSNLRIFAALVTATAQHRLVGTGGEELIPLEILFGVVLMSAWRFLHSANTPRI